MVTNSGHMGWHKGRVFVSEVFRNEEIGLEQTDEGGRTSSLALPNWVSLTAPRCGFARRFLQL
jgi:hypothetical protein